MREGLLARGRGTCTQLDRGARKKAKKIRITDSKSENRLSKNVNPSLAVKSKQQLYDQRCHIQKSIRFSNVLHTVRF